MTTTIETDARAPDGADFAPYLSLSQVRRAARRGGAPEGPEEERLDGAVLHLDITGFTRFTERLLEEGPRGAEELLGVLNVCFGRMLTAAGALGGDATSFAGDALTFLFRAEGDIGDAVARAARAGVEIQRSLEGFEPRPGFPIRARASVGAGAVELREIGGHGGRWFQVAGGDAYRQAWAADRGCRPGSVTLSAESAAAARGRVALAANREVTGVPRVDGPPQGRREAPPPGAAEHLAACLVPVVADRLREGLSRYLAEFRAVTVLFATVVAPSLDLDAMHRAARAAQEEVERFGGVLYQVVHDEKGYSLIAGFGLPPLSHDDDARRAAECALALAEALGALGHGAAAGLGTGTLFCGLYGTPERQQYAMVGPTINRAARLMQALGGPGIYADERTRRDGDRGVTWEDLGLVSVKGVASALAVHRPLGRATGAHGPARLIGRERELAALDAAFDALAAEGRGGTVMVTGDAGMGKSTVLAAALARARSRGLRVVAGAADSLEQRTPLFALRPLVRGVAGVSPKDAPDEARARAREAIAAAGEDPELLALLNTALPLGAPEGPLVAQMSGPIRSENLNRVLLALVARATEAEPFVLSVEDVHWLDGASWALLEQVVNTNGRVLLVTTSRPMDPWPAEHARLERGPSRRRLDLGPLDRDETIALVRQRLGVRSLPVNVKDLIAARSEGNPFFSEECALALRDAGVIAVVDGECRVNDTALRKVDLPGNVRGVVTNRIDRLSAALQLTLKVASVVGRAFERRVLEAIHPVPADRARVAEHCEELRRVELVVPEGADAWVFRHAITHETSYDLLPFAERRALHRAAADHLERAPGAAVAQHHPRLAYHFTEADVPEKAVKYLALAGTEALASYANQSAVEFFQKALEFDERLRGLRPVDLTRARWLRMMGEALYSLVRYDKAQACLCEAMERCGFPPPVAGARTPVELARHLWNRARPRPPTDDDDERARCVEALRAADAIVPLYLWAGNMGGVAHTVLEAANIAAVAGPTPETAFAISMVGFLEVMGGLHGAAVRDLREAAALADAQGQLLQVCSTHVWLGLSYSLLGRFDEARPALARGEEAADRLGAGLWRHRASFMRTEPYLLAGDVETSAALFDKAARISIGAEPPIAGYANCMRALCLRYRGRVDEALAVVTGPSGLQLVRDNPMKLQLYVCLGVLAECRLLREEMDEALPVAEEALALASEGDDVYSFMAGHYGCLSVTQYWLEAWTRRLLGRPALGALPVAGIADRARRSVKHFRRYARTYPALGARYAVMARWADWCDGRHGRALAGLRDAAEDARRRGMPFDEVLALQCLARFTAPPGRVDALRRLVAVASRHGIEPERERAERALEAC